MDIVKLLSRCSEFKNSFKSILQEFLYTLLILKLALKRTDCNLIVQYYLTVFFSSIFIIMVIAGNI